MNKKYIFAGIPFFILIAVALTANNLLAVTLINPLGAETFPALFDKIATFLIAIGGPIGTLMILYAAFLFMTSGGEPEKIKKAKMTILYALIGLAVLISAKGLTLLVKDVLDTSKSGSSPYSNSSSGSSDDFNFPSFDNYSGGSDLPPSDPFKFPGFVK